MAGENDNDDLELDLEEGEGEVEGEGSTESGGAQEKAGEQEDGGFVAEIDPEDPDAAASDAEGGAADDSEDAELAAKREARRQERQERKQRQREKEERVQRELAQAKEQNRQLAKRLENLERRNSGAEVAQIDTVLKQAEGAVAFFKDQIADAASKNDGQRIAEATEKMIQARERVKQLTNVKQAHERQQSAPAPLDENMVTLANDFMAKHKWYKPDGQDNDSVLMRTIDNMVAGEGWDPTTREYWQELDSRVKKYLPHRAKGAKVSGNDQGESEAQPKGKPKSVVSGSGSGSAGSSGAGKTTFKLSAQRVQAIKDAGMWDDAAQRNKMIRNYMAYDKANKGGK